MPMFESLSKKGCKLPTGYTILEALSTYDIGSLVEVDLKSVDLDTRRRYLSYPIWADFLTHRLPALLKAAQKAPPGKDRDSALAAALSICEDKAADVPGPLREEVQMAASLFSMEQPLAGRVAYAIEAEGSAKYAAGWVSDFPFEALPFFFQKPPPSTYYGLTFPEFKTAADFLLTREGEDARASIENTVFTGLLDFMEAAVALRREPWWESLLHTVLAGRLGCSAGLVAPVVTWSTVFDSPAIVELGELLPKHFKGCKPSLGNWYGPLKARADMVRAASKSDGLSAAKPAAAAVAAKPTVPAGAAVAPAVPATAALEPAAAPVVTALIY